VFTCVGGKSLFWELDLGSAEVRFAKRPSKDIACGNERADNVLTYVGGLSLFQELDMDSHMKLEESVDEAEDNVSLMWASLSQTQIVFGVTLVCEQIAFAYVKSVIGDVHGVIDKVPPWRKNIPHHNAILPPFPNISHIVSSTEIKKCNFLKNTPCLGGINPRQLHKLIENFA
jgi:hypothetical protein